MKEGIPLRIQRRLTLLFVAVAGFSTLLAGLFLNRAMGRHLTGQAAAKLEHEARLVRDFAASTPDLPSSADPLADRLGRDLSVRVTLIAADGKVLGDTDLDGEALAQVENHAGRPEIRDALRTGSGQSVRYSHTVGEWMLYVALRLDAADPSRGVVRLAVPLIAVRKAQEELRVPLVGAFLLSVVAAAVFGWLAARGPARRLEAISWTASAIANGRTEARAETHGRDEVAELARSVNRMADQLAERLSLLNRERDQLRSVLDGMVEGVLLTDSAGTILLANPAFERIFDANLPVAGRRPLEAARVPALQEAVEAALGADESIAREFTIPGSPGRLIRANLASIREGDRRVGAVAVFHDVTELRRLETVRREFVANVSHELRTPLTAIRGYAETLKEGGLGEPGQAAEFVEVIHRNTLRLQSLIEDLLDLSSIEQGQARITLGPVRLREVAAQADAVIRPAAERKGQSLSFDLPADVPDPVADRDRLAQVLINLLDNAVKFTPEKGSITVTARRANDRVVLAVADTGAGIPPDEVGRIFERFYRVDRSRDRREGGTGLGLAIAKHLVQAMGGAIEVKSVLGSGTTFRLTFPAA